MHAIHGAGVAVVAGDEAVLLVAVVVGDGLRVDVVAKEGAGAGHVRRSDAAPHRGMKP
uniref:Uncharacterized protein n=1 Tax=Arundo donax TaxID=35708 RepID=A0A0A9ESY2_ARUDO